MLKECPVCFLLQKIVVWSIIVWIQFLQLGPGLLTCVLGLGQFAWGRGICFKCGCSTCKFLLQVQNYGSFLLFSPAGELKELASDDHFLGLPEQTVDRDCTLLAFWVK